MFLFEAIIGLTMFSSLYRYLSPLHNPTWVMEMNIDCFSRWDVHVLRQHFYHFWLETCGWYHWAIRARLRTLLRKIVQYLLLFLIQNHLIITYLDCTKSLIHLKRRKQNEKLKFRVNYSPKNRTGNKTNIRKLFASSLIVSTFEYVISIAMKIRFIE